ncbi:MAG: hypothetical protein WKG01_12975 [Kofleriaceae bacterium]
MANVRLILVAALVGCGQAGAEPPGLTVPKGWEKLPAIAEAVRTATASKTVRSATVDAWGERAMGCYAVRLQLTGAGAPAALAQQILDGIKTEPTIAVRDVVSPPGPGVLSFAFDRPPYRGRMRALLGSGTISAVACFANQREPQACALACDGVLGGIK